MNELYYTIDHYIKNKQVYLLIKISAAEKRLLYGDTLRKLTKDKEREAIDFLINEEIKFRGGSSSIETIAFNEIHIAKERSNEAIKWLARTGNFLWNGRKLFVDPFSNAEFFYEAFFEEEGLLKVEGYLKIGDKKKSVSSCDFIFPGTPPWFILDGVLQSFKDKIDWKWIENVHKDPLILEGEHLKQFCEQFEDDDLPRAPKVIWKNEPPPSYTIDVIPFLVLKDRTGAFADLWFDYGPKGKVAAQSMDPLSWRNKEAEKAWEKDLLETDFQKKTMGNSHYYCPLNKVAKSLTFLLEIGWQIYDHAGKRVLKQERAELSLEMAGQDVLVRGGLSYTTHKADIKDVLGAFTRREAFVALDNHTVGLLDPVFVQKEWGALSGEEIIKEGVAVKKCRFGILSDFFKNPDVQKDKDCTDLATRIQASSGIKETNPSSLFCGSLFPYQQEGLNWLSFLHESGFHGLLADEMGLGKTVQILALFSLMEKGPILIVVPTSLLFNWRREIEKFLPEASLYIHAGKDRTTVENRKIILTSYAILRQDKDLLQKVEYECIVLDEAQYIKNASSQTAQIAFRLNGKLRLAISGTPIENRLEELWSIFYFLMPELLGDSAEFNAKIVAAQLDARHLEQIKKKVRPFILRRRKEEVALDLPPKLSQVIWIEMNEQQKAIYEEWVQKNHLGLLKKIQEDGVSAHRMEILEAILRLRQICCHPLLVDASLEGDVLEMSGKLERLLEDLEEAMAQKRKVLIYSQFTQMLALIQQELKKRNWSYAYLDGSTKDREGEVRRFQEDPNLSLFLISLKAGGVGLNLTAADYVFLFDPWWNEAVEEQAIDRAHRLGRTTSVIARRYVMANSIEEKMMRLKSQKTSLAKGLLEFDQELSHLSLDDLYNLLT